MLGKLLGKIYAINPLVKLIGGLVIVFALCGLGIAVEGFHSGVPALILLCIVAVAFSVSIFGAAELKGGTVWWIRWDLIGKAWKELREQGIFRK